ncbi:MAG: SDR family NAD(P)-dependent oxidoreductase [Desertimonas sp.]
MLRATGPGSGDVPTGRLRGRRALVTGAAQGIGRAIAERMAAEGATLGLIDLDPDVKNVADGLGARASTVDLGDADATRGVIDEVIGELGGIDILVNNAGIFQLMALLDLSIQDWDRMHAINTRSMLVTTQVAARAMIGAGTGGAVVNLASMVAKQPAPDQAHYAASKAGVIALTQAAALELGPAGIRVNCVCPGYVLTAMGADTRTPEMVTEWSARSPLGRCAEPDDVAGVVTFLASDDAAYLTGQSVNVTGGMIMH